MAKIVNNTLTSTFSGQVGDDIIFRRIGNRTFVMKKGVNTKPATPAQRGRRNLFTEAQFYASGMLENPEKNQWYSIVAKVNGIRNAQLAAVKDFMSKPEIDTINTKGYTGNIGAVMYIIPKMLLKITRIEVTLYRADGVVLESGLAVKHELHWKYVTTVFNQSVEGSKMAIVAHDSLEKSCTVIKHLVLQ
jgi:hypothetical protein